MKFVWLYIKKTSRSYLKRKTIENDYTMYSVYGIYYLILNMY